SGCYWDLAPYFRNKVTFANQAKVEEKLRELVEDTVRLRLVSDVPLGAFLSGGVDSSAVVALMSELSPGRVKTFSIGFDESDFSEIKHARRVANRFSTDHHEFVVRPDAMEVLPMLVRHYGEPYADSSAIPTYYLSKMTRQHVTVALNGDGGDECFAGYERYAAMRISEQYHRLPRSLRENLLDPLLATLPEPGITRSRLGKVRRFLSVMDRPRTERYLRWASAISEDLKFALCTPEFLHRAGSSASVEYLRPWFAGNGSLDIVDRALKADTESYLPNDLLVKVDIASMAASVEARSPFLDHRLMEFAAKLPASYKMRGVKTKYLLKQALRGLLPAENLTRGKMGFGVPIGHWLRDELKGLLQETVLSQKAESRGYFRPNVVRNMVEQHQSGKRDYAHQLWTLLMLELWHREFMDG
ncbi:MAG TPA: asparagine synthase-related protein, partial [Blastocatellia bacterium]|nr:asparagine synthase-related protein [Blastocatellia bacterium]